MALLTNLDNEIFANSALEGFVNELLMLTAFSRNFSAAPGTKGNDILVPLIGGLTATTFNGSYNISGGTQSVITVSLNRHKIVRVGQNDLTAASSSAATLEAYSYQAGAELGRAVLTDILTLVNSTNFGIATAFVSTAMDVPHIRAARLALNIDNVPKEPRALALDCTPYDSLLGVTNFVQAQLKASAEAINDGTIGRALGFGIYEVNGLFTQPSVIGFAAHANAIAIAMRYLQPQQGNSYADARPISDPRTGLTFGLRDHYDNNTGERYVNLECNYG